MANSTLGQTTRSFSRNCFRLIVSILRTLNTSLSKYCPLDLGRSKSSGRNTSAIHMPLTMLLPPHTIPAHRSHPVRASTQQPPTPPITNANVSSTPGGPSRRGLLAAAGGRWVFVVGSSSTITTQHAWMMMSQSCAYWNRCACLYVYTGGSLLLGASPASPASATTMVDVNGTSVEAYAFKVRSV